MARGELAMEKAESAARLSAIEQILVSQQKWTKLIAGLMLLVTLLLAIIATLLVLHFPMGKFDAEDGAADGKASSKSRRRRVIAPTMSWTWNDAETESQPKHSIFPQPPPSKLSQIVSILNGGFTNLTTKLDKILQLTENFAPIHVKAKCNSTGETAKQKVKEKRKRKGSRRGHYKSGSSGLEMVSHLKTIAQIESNVSSTLDVIVDRFFAMDYRQPNFSCPHQNRGDYQYIGPDGYYSTCYYVKPNVLTLTEAKSICDRRNGKLVEFDSILELEYLQNISSNFWLGAERSLESGFWHWQESGLRVNFDLWKIDENSLNQWSERKLKEESEKSDKLAAVSQKKTFKVLRDTGHSGFDVICEVPSRFEGRNPPPPADPFPAQEWDTYNSSVTDSAYLFSTFMLPWSGAEEFCRARGGFLAEVESPAENEDLIARMKKYSKRSRWLGAKSRGSRWIWHGSNRSLEHAFTDWKPGMNTAEDSSCSFISTSDKRGFYWDSQSCLNWRHFVCEIGSMNDSIAAESKQYLGDQVCHQNTYEFDGFATTVKNCFHLVKLQLSFEKAEKYCRDNFNESIASVDAKQRPKFEPILRENLGNRDQAHWWMKISPYQNITFDSNIPKLVLVNEKGICYDQMSAVGQVICRQLGFTTLEKFDNSHRRPQSGMVDVKCNGDELSLDECKISTTSCNNRYFLSRSSRSSRSSALVTCGTNTPRIVTFATFIENPVVRTRCPSAVQSKKELLSSSAECNNLHWFICEAKPEIIYDIQR